ncbi:MAG: hypothetical protein KIT09_10690 [Bryobacteraceae bacterium]|nr:hypothetical protein [Bryobacteraceae bacterium]
MSRLWAITSYFNPAGYRRKLPNYREFRNGLAVPLAAVELSHSGRFELGPGDADILVQLRGGDVMWQKERLLNIAADHLPDECGYVAWLDCDVVFSRSDWAWAAMRELERAGVCQLYRSVYHLAPDAASISREASILRHDSLGYAFANGLNGPGGAGANGSERVFKRGHAWAARRETLAGHGLYDRNVVGGGDSLLAHAAKGRAEEVIARHGMTAAHADDYRRWAERFRAAVNGIGYIEGDIFHLWHGNLERRRYQERLQILSSCGYDPAADIALDAEGCWRWSSPKPDMHRMVKEYFACRQEDGEYLVCAVSA